MPSEAAALSGDSQTPVEQGQTSSVAHPRKEPGTGDRRGEMLEAAKARVFDWRYTMWKRDMRWSALGEAALLSDNDVQTVSKKRGIRSIETLRMAVPTWAQRDKYEHTLLALLLQILRDEDEQRACGQRKKDAERAAAQRAKEQAKQRERELHMALHPPARRPTKAQLRQAERDAQASQGIRLRGRPTKIELARRAVVASSSSSNDSPMAASATISTPTASSYASAAPLAALPAATPTPTAPLYPPHTPIQRATSHSQARRTESAQSAQRPLAFALQHTAAHLETPTRTRPSNFVVVPLGDARSVLTDLNGRKRPLDDSDVGPHTLGSPSKRARTAGG